MPAGLAGELINRRNRNHVQMTGFAQLLLPCDRISSHEPSFQTANPRLGQHPAIVNEEVKSRVSFQLGFGYDGNSSTHSSTRDNKLYDATVAGSWGITGIVGDTTVS